MAQKPIQGSDIIEVNALDNAIQDATKLLTVYKQLDSEILQVAKSTKTISTNFKANVAGDLQKIAQAEREITQAALESEKLKQGQIKTESQLITLQRKKQTEINREIKQQQMLKDVYKQESAELNKLRIAYKNLAAQGRENGKVARGLLGEITRLDTKLKGIDNTVGQNQRSVGKYGLALDGLKSKFQGVLGLASQFGLVLGGGILVKKGLDVLVSFDEKLADIAKTTGLTIDGAREVSQSLLNIDTSTTIENLQELAVAAGRLGIKGKQDIIDFATAADKVFVALGDDLGGTADEIATNLGKIANIFGDEARFGIGESITKTGSALNELAANSKANAGNILEFTNRLAGVSAQAGIAQTDIQALGALFDESGQSIEVAATTLNVLLPELAKNQEKFAKVAGLTADEFKNLLQNNPIDALKAVAVGASNSEGGLVGLTKTLEDFGVESARATSIVGVLASSTDRLTELQNLSREAFENGTSVTEEFDIKNATLGATLSKLNKEFQKQVLGIDETGKASNKLKSILGFLINNLGTIVSIIKTATIAYVAYKTAVIALTVAEKANIVVQGIRTLGLKGYITTQLAATSATVAGTTATTGATAATKLFALALRALPIGLIITGLVALAHEFQVFEDSAEKARGALKRMEDDAKAAFETLKNTINDTNNKTDDLLKSRIANLKAAGKSEEEIIKELTNVYKDELDKRIDIEKKDQQFKDKFSALNPANQNIQDNIFGGQSDKIKKFADQQKELNKNSIQLSESESKRINELAQNEEKRVARIKELLAEYKETSGENAANRVTERDALTGLAKLQKEYNDLEKKRSDLLVANNGIANDEFIVMTNQSEELLKQIKILENRLSLSKQFFDQETIEKNKIQKVSSRGTTADNIGVQRTGKTIEEIAQEEIERLKKVAEARAEQVEKLKNLSQDLTDITVFSVNRRIEALDLENQAQQRNYDEAVNRENQLIALREQGASVSAESLAFERKAQAEALAEQEKIAKRKQRLELITAGINTFNAQVQNGNGNALGTTIGDIGALVGFLNSLPAFWDGTDTTVGDALGMKVSNGRDGILARVDKSEIILNKEKADQLKGMTTDEITKGAKLYQMGLVGDKSTSVTAMPIFSNSEVVKQLEYNNQLLSEIARKPTSNISVEQLADIVRMKEVISQRNATTTKIKHIRR